MTLTGNSGSIILNSTLHDGITHCLWTIEAENDQNIMLKFDKSFGFDIEYHRQCGFDKLHIIDGNTNVRMARICGPKRNYDRNRFYLSKIQLEICI
ncbi:unnamed protein product [Oikopleura dioica]|uniref:CUB domain-containing protein n=1 Tax=Oikopleura dioica TaxID=34765 RepID=E4WSP5_OIKDI|nr:unnamed protein product [Oikopleura dioica]